MYLKEKKFKREFNLADAQKTFSIGTFIFGISKAVNFGGNLIQRTTYLLVKNHSFNKKKANMRVHFTKKTVVQPAHGPIKYTYTSEVETVTRQNNNVVTTLKTKEWAELVCLHMDNDKFN